MGVRRGVIKTPGGKLVAVTVATDSMGLVNECRLDGDFFIDGDEVRSRSLLDDLERTLLACARGAAARVTGTQDGDAPASAGKSRLPRGRTAQSETYGDEKCADIGDWSDALRRTCMRHGGARLVGTDAGAMAWALARAMGLEPVARPGLNGASDKVATETGAAVESADGRESDPSCAAPRPNTDWPEDWRDRWRTLAPVVIHDRPRSPIEQMAIDRQWAREVAAGTRPPNVRFWEWTSPAVVVGRFQSIPDEVHVDEAERLGFTVVRRCTGGGTMVVQPHGAITYSLYASQWFVDGLGAAEAYRLCDSWLIDALQGLGVDARFQGLNDIAVPGGGMVQGAADGDSIPSVAPWGKAGGAAQRRFPAPSGSGGPGAVLHHTTLAFDLDGALMARMLNTSLEKMHDKAVRSAAKRVSPLCLQPALRNVGRDVLLRTLADSLRRLLSVDG